MYLVPVHSSPRLQSGRFIQRPSGNRTVSAGDQSAHTIGEVRYFGSGPFGDQPVHEGSGECVAGSYGIGHMHGMAQRFDIVTADENSATSLAHRDTDGLPAVAVCSFTAESFDGVRQSGEVPHAIEFFFIEFDNIRPLQKARHQRRGPAVRPRRC